MPGVTNADGSVTFVSNCVSPATNCGIWLSVASMPTVLVFSSSSVPTVISGLEDSRSRRTMREPVTVISSTACLLRCLLLRISRLHRAARH